ESYQPDRVQRTCANCRVLRAGRPAHSCPIRRAPEYPWQGWSCHGWVARVKLGEWRASLCSCGDPSPGFVDRIGDKPLAECLVLVASCSRKSREIDGAKRLSNRMVIPIVKDDVIAF